MSLLGKIVMGGAKFAYKALKGGKAARTIPGKGMSTVGSAAPWTKGMQTQLAKLPSLGTLTKVATVGGTAVAATNVFRGAFGGAGQRKPRRMNSLNLKALNRAMKRIVGSHQVMMRMEQLMAACAPRRKKRTLRSKRKCR